MKVEVPPAQNINQNLQTIEVSGDKSISHRALLFSALADGESQIDNPLLGEDVQATWNILRDCSIQITQLSPTQLRVKGNTFKAPSKELDCANAGTLIRIFFAIAASKNIPCTLIGDASLMQRPMARVTDLLCSMGANISTNQGKPPVVIETSNQPLTGGRFDLKVASAQVKTALLLAGLNSKAPVIIHEPQLSRNHSELMLPNFGAKISHTEDGAIKIMPGPLHACNIVVPGDFSSAAFFLALACLIPGMKLLIKNVNLNPTRTGLLTAMQQMNAEVKVVSQDKSQLEPRGDIEACYSPNLSGIKLDSALVPTMIDEFPIFSVLAACAKGESSFTNAAELRVKESDRLGLCAKYLSGLSAQITEYADGMKIIPCLDNQGRLQVKNSIINANGDHRIAMAFAIAALRADKNLIIENCECIDTSFPIFFKLFEQLQLQFSKF